LKHPRDANPIRFCFRDEFHSDIPRPPTLIDKIDKKVNVGKHVSHNQG
jgi:hypothetical protein